MEEYITRMGDGRRVRMTKEQIEADIVAGMADGADAARVPELSQDEMDRILEIVCDKSKITSIEPGREVCLSKDAGAIKFNQDNGGSGNAIPCMGRLEGLLVYERCLTFDSMELAWMDYSIKPVKAVINCETSNYEQMALMTTLPLVMGAMPNMGLYYAPDGPYPNPTDLMREFKIEESMAASEAALYYAPDGPYPNPTDLMREFKIEESMAASEAAAEHLTRDIGYVCQEIDKVGCEGFNFDTVASAGDAEFVATLKGIENYRKSNPNAYIECGMSAENVLGIHGGMEYDGKIVAGMYPQDQVKLAEKAGTNIFGSVVNTNTSKSFAWNAARSAVITKACVEAANIPVHANMGMGVGGIPMCELPPTDITGRAAKILIEIANIDGI